MLHRLASIDENAIAIHRANLVADRMRQRRLAQTDVVLRALPRLTCPVDVLFGAEDALYRSQLGRMAVIFQKAPGFREICMIPGAGHWVQYEEADRFNAELIRMLRAAQRAS